MVQPGRPTRSPTIVGLPLVYRESSDSRTWMMRVAVVRPGQRAFPQLEEFEITQRVAEAILKGPEASFSGDQRAAVTDEEYQLAVQQAMEELANQPSASDAQRRVEELLSAPTEKKNPKRVWQLPAERMRARLEKARQVAERALLEPYPTVPAALEEAIGAIKDAKFVTGAAAHAQVLDTAVHGSLRERRAGETATHAADLPHREEPRALTLEIRRTLNEMKNRALGARRTNLEWIADKFASVDQPDRVWGDAENRTILRFARDFLREIDQEQRGLQTQKDIFDPLPSGLNREFSYNLWYVARWADLLAERAETKKALLGAATVRQRQAHLQTLSEARETGSGRQARNTLTQSKEIQIQASQEANVLSDEVQQLVNRDRGSFVVELQRPDGPTADTFVVSHRYDPELANSGDPSSLMATAPSSAGKQRPILTSARQVVDVETGHSILALGRLNTADRWLDAETFMLSELFEDPRTAPLATKVFVEGITSAEKDAVEILLRRLPLPTGITWVTQPDGQRLQWEPRGDRWKPKVDVAFLDLNLMTAGPGGPDTGDKPEWSPATALWNRGEKAKAIALIVGRLLGLGLPYLVELGIARFLAEQRWSEQEAAIGQLMQGQKLDILGIPATLHTMSMNRAFNVYGEKGLLRSVFGLKGREKRLSEQAERALHARLDRKKAALDRDKRELAALLERPDSQIKQEYLKLIGSTKLAERLRCDRLFQYLRTPRDQREATLMGFERQKARLEGLWTVAFGEGADELPEAQMVALIELSKELNVRIGAHCKSGKDRTGNFVGLFVATRQFFKSHPESSLTEEQLTDPAQWADYIRSIPKKPLFHANAEVVDQILNQQQADMMQVNRTLDRAPIAGRIMGKSQAPQKAPWSYRWAGVSGAGALSHAQPPDAAAAGGPGGV
jgi:hypothetical protein